ncbi:MAG: anhydro-N-acetylmuramic acid kinase [Planctomycetota bacterium]
MSDTIPRVRHVVGCMTGTSLDALDAVLTRIVGTGLDMTAEFVGMYSVDLPDDLRATLLSMGNGEPHPPLEYLRTARYIGVFHAQAVADLIQKFPHEHVDFVVPHGQTIWHAPDDAISWQLFDPWPIVHSLKLPVCYDLRQADLVAGGEGAPITPLADWVMYRHDADVVINLGGVANLTVLGAQATDIDGFDQGPCNLMLDGLCRALFDERYDRDGRHALAGRVDPEVLAVMRAAVDAISRDGSKGREQYSTRWSSQLASTCLKTASAEDVLRSAVHLVATLIAAYPKERGSQRWVLGGGGVRNRVLMQELRDQSGGAQVQASDERGIPAEAREAMGFAVLGALSADGVPITLPQVTGSTSPGVAGSWAYPNGPKR